MLAAVKTASCRKRPVAAFAIEIRCPLTRKFLEIPASRPVVVADANRIHQRRAAQPGDFHAERSKKASHSVKTTSVAGYRPGFLSGVSELHRPHASAHGAIHAIQ